MTTGRINQVTTIRDLHLKKLTRKTGRRPASRAPASPPSCFRYTHHKCVRDARQTSSVDDLRGNSFPRPTLRLGYVRTTPPHGVVSTSHAGAPRHPFSLARF